LSAIGLEVQRATRYIFVENFVGVIGQLPEVVLQSLAVFLKFPVAFSPGPAKTEGAITRDAIDKAEDKNRFFMMK
jgi:hypothetical protein